MTSRTDASLPDPLPILPFTRPAHGSVTIPGSKSITNRALILAALCDGPVTLENALFSRDTRIMMEALRQLGFSVTSDESARTITLCGLGGTIPAERASLHVGNAGTAARFLTAFLCLRQGGEYVLDGDPAMRERPMKGLLDALRSQGTEVTFQGTENHFPFVLKTRGLRGGAIELDAAASSQLLSAVMMAAALAEKQTVIRLRGQTVSQPFVAMTAQMMRQFGLRIEGDSEGGSWTIPPGQARLQEERYPIEIDATAATYFGILPLVAGGALSIPGLRVRQPALQGDFGFFELLEERGLLSIDGLQLRAGPSRSGLEADFNAISDTFLTLAAVAPLLETPTRIRGIGHTRHQETDRIAAMATEIKKITGPVNVREEESSLEITPPSPEEIRRNVGGGVLIETYEDHRIAMSFAILGSFDLFGDGRSWLSIRDPQCCGKTFPEFFQVLAALRQTGAAPGNPAGSFP